MLFRKIPSALVPTKAQGDFPRRRIENMSLMLISLSVCPVYVGLALQKGIKKKKTWCVCI